MILLYQDESAIRDYQAIQKSWFLIGQQRIIPTYGQHKSVKLLGVLNYETGEVLVEEAEHYDATVFQTFLEKVLAHYPEGSIIMVLDNARIHHAKLIQPFLKDNPRLELVFLPPYSPNLNPIERLWRWLKDTCINNVFYSNSTQIRESVDTFIDWVNTIPQTAIDRLCL